MNQIKELKCLNCGGKIKSILGLYAKCRQCKSLFEINWIEDADHENDGVDKK
jgi:hypothetical protein